MPQESTSWDNQQVAVDLILMRGREAVGRAWIVDLLGALDQRGRLLRRVFDRNDLVIFTVLGNARRGVTRIVLATTQPTARSRET